MIMPIYDYACPDCGKTTSVLRKADDYQVPPDAEEWNEAPGLMQKIKDLVLHSCKHANAYRVIGKATIARTDNWMRHGGKGFW